MPLEILDPETLAVRLPARQRLIGLDLGTKTIGMAVSDLERRIATPLTVIQRRKFTLDVAEMLKIADREAIGAFVMGLPINMDGTEGPRAQATRAFVRNLTPLTDIPLIYWDERLSTAAAERNLIEADLSRKKRAAVIDQNAAAFILQGALDRLDRLAVDPDQFAG